MKLDLHSKTAQAILALALCGSAAVAEADVSISRSKESLVKPGMTPAEVQQALGRPAARFRYRSSDGATWTYNVVESTPGTVFFDVDFDANGKVASTRVRVNPSPG